jgi:hypothetical protein
MYQLTPPTAIVKGHK